MVIRINLKKSMRSAQFRLQSSATISKFTWLWVKFTVYALLKYTYLKNTGTAHNCSLCARTESHWCSDSYCQRQLKSLLPCFSVRTKSIHKWHYCDAGVRQGWWLWTSFPCWPQGNLVFMALHTPTSTEEAVISLPSPPL